MTERDTAEALRDQLLSAFALLTRLPLPQPATFRGGAAAWLWPVVGLAVGGLMAAGGWLALWLGMPAGVAGAVALAVAALATGALHEDGLADTADGLFGGWTKERRLEIMKDSRIGSYGVLALLVVTLARWSALTVLVAGGHWAAICAAAALSRAPMALVMAALPNARGNGLSSSTGRPPARAAAGAAGMALLLALVLTGGTAVAMALAAIATTAGIAALARRKIGGQTGDILGATQQMAETAALAVAAG
ncbi:MAG: adenosylcobinamide-GDP ribazoletransferase [Pseudomonadota bacterium]